MSYLRRHSYSFCLLFCIVLAFSACGQPGIDGGLSTTSTPVATARPASASSTTKVTPIPGAALLQSCPEAASVRAAVMPAMKIGDHPNIVYFFQGKTGNVLQRYDMVTATTTTLLNGAMTPLSISPDGQWIVLSATTQNQTALQLVRTDGQQRQTLSCLSGQINIVGARFSPDQHFLAVAKLDDTTNISTIDVLDLMTGKLRTVLSSQQLDYPGLALVGEKMEAIHLPVTSSIVPRLSITNRGRSLPLDTLSGRVRPIFTPMRWESNNSLLLLSRVQASPAPAPLLYRLRDVSKDASQPGNLQLLTGPKAEGDNCQDYALTPDNQRLVCNMDVGPGVPIQAAVKVMPVSGGTFHTVYKPQAGDIREVCAITNSTLLFTLEQVGHPETIWKVNFAGKDLVQLTSVTAKNEMFALKNWSSLWSECAVDGSLYTVVMNDPEKDTGDMAVGSLAGGALKTIASQKSGLEPVGWTRL
ncbi:hypothetical protein EPA93_38230 [Ktedonosporobacter rubrisoli]|uniref:WD40 repeat domain-containing protein n=1 Tax=Ktedonosporobacter rubrisoli TaxID=2509675 RepID=A0A4P6K0C7_KTERU|nr:hypothetical protein [Ktedonosporobacter rubrisoli]QBD81499.1 hypothetical protein EPA93_38230 [Ktedonosporobacter rubrisoli]